MAYAGRATNLMQVQTNISNALVIPATTDERAFPEYTDDAGNFVRSYGWTVPTDGSAGFAVGCTFRDLSGGIGTTLYVNEGSTTSCDFNAVT